MDTSYDPINTARDNYISPNEISIMWLSDAGGGGGMDHCLIVLQSKS